MKHQQQLQCSSLPTPPPPPALAAAPSRPQALGKTRPPTDCRRPHLRITYLTSILSGLPFTNLACTSTDCAQGVGRQPTIQLTRVESPRRHLTYGPFTDP